jgi:hypothetical protein
MDFLKEDCTAWQRLAEREKEGNSGRTEIAAWRGWPTHRIPWRTEMLKTWSMTVASFLIGSFCLAGETNPGTLPPLPTTTQVSANNHAIPAPPVAVVEAPGHPGACCDHRKHDSCLECLVRYFSYCPCQLTSIHELYEPYNPQPPLYLYFLHPPVLEGPPHTYPCCAKNNCWSSSCSAGPHMFALPSGQNAGFDH